MSVLLRPRSLAATTGLAALTVSTLVLGAPAATSSAEPGPTRAETVRTWNAVAVRTIVVENAVMPGPAQLYLGLVSSAVHDALTRSMPGRVSVRAAVATAAHDVLVEYFPSSTAALDTDLDALLDAVPDGRPEDIGAGIGRRAADRLITARADDGRDADITLEVGPYPAPGEWRPTPPGFLPMAFPWLGFVDPLLLDSPTSIDVGGPDALTSAAYAADVAEVQRLGAKEGSDRTPFQTETGNFWNFSVPVMFNDGLRDWAERTDMGARATARMFALLNMTAADAIITGWRGKYDEAYWRPITAIQLADTDRNDATVADPEWEPLFTTPPYPDWPSGHGSVTSAYLRGLTKLTGSDAIDLTLTNTALGISRHYTSAATARREAFMSRIYLGIHFRDAMQDAYRIGTRAADLGFKEFRQAGR